MSVFNLDPQELSRCLKELSQMIKAARKRKGISQVRAAELMGIDYRHYQNVEGGKINLRLDTLLKLLSFYELEFYLGNARPASGAATNGGEIQIDMKDGLILDASSEAAKALGALTTTEIVGRQVSDVLSPTTWQKIRQSFTETLPPNPMAPVEIYVPLKGRSTCRILRLLPDTNSTSGFAERQSHHLSGTLLEVAAEGICPIETTAQSPSRRLVGNAPTRFW